MLVVGLVHGSSWRPPDDAPSPRRGPRRHVPWRALAWVAAFCWLMALVPVAEEALGGLAGYAVLLLAVALGFWRVERWCARQYTLLIPNVQSRNTADWTLESAVKMLERAAGAPIEGQLGGTDAFESVRQALAEGAYDDVIISTLPRRTSEWLRRDLPRRVEQLGVPVTVITPPEEPGPLKAFTESFSAKAPPASGA